MSMAITASPKCVIRHNHAFSVHMMRLDSTTPGCAGFWLKTQLCILHFTIRTVATVTWPSGAAFASAKQCSTSHSSICLWHRIRTNRAQNCCDIPPQTPPTTPHQHTTQPQKPLVPGYLLPYRSQNVGYRYFLESHIIRIIIILASVTKT